jgi:pimeloyl-ACP methyl ester carboxylesterase
VAATVIDDIGRPPVLALGLELPRSVTELAVFVSAAPFMFAAPKGDGHPVLVLPGFMADDRTTISLRRHLRRRGYLVRGWQLGRNIGPTTAAIEGMRRTVDDMASSTGRRVSLVGWSLGGMYARELARLLPDAVRQVVSLGSPMRLRSVAQTHTDHMYDRFRHRHDERYRMPGYRYVDAPLEVPSSSIYTRTDGIVPWRACLQQEGRRSENIEVRGSHCGLGHNLAAVLAIDDRLAQAEGGWRRFEPPSALRPMYPRPARVTSPSGSRR